MPRVLRGTVHCALVFFRLLEKSDPFALSLSKDAFPFYKGGLHRGIKGVEKSC